MKISSSFIMAFAIMVTTTASDARPRVLVLTDVSNEPDDEQSLVRFLVYANEFEVEGLVATTSTWLKETTREDLIRRQLKAYAEVRPNLLKHADGYPEAARLEGVTATGQPGFGMAATGAEKSTPGSRLVVAAIDRPDPRPLWVNVWGGANTLAQALSDIRGSRTAEETDKAIAKIRVYSISDQDDAGRWLRKEFPGLFYIVSPSAPEGHPGYEHSTWSGISGDRHYGNGPRHRLELVENPWLRENVIDGHGPLGRLYPELKYIMEGDTPAFLGLIGNGLGSEENPGHGGWGGRYVLGKPAGETREIWTNRLPGSSDRVTLPDGKSHASDQATIWRWREHFQNDFAARMDWCVASSFADANHNPRPVLNGSQDRSIVFIKAAPGTDVPLSAAGSMDPDQNNLRFTWWIYPEAGTIEGATVSSGKDMETSVRIPKDSGAGNLHVILETRDDGAPNLFAYRRAIIEVAP